MSLQKNLVWIDLEMTGLKPDTDRILEMAVIVTDQDLNILAESPVIAVHQPEEVLALMDDWNQKTHGESGLVARVRSSTVSETEAEQIILEFLHQHAERKASPMCGNTVSQDRRFLARYMKELEAFFHYRNLDVSTIKELVRRWRPDIASGLSKKNTHKALDDIRESIDELRYYRATFLRMEE